jgi:hypothetical protein
LTGSVRREELAFRIESTNHVLGIIHDQLICLERRGQLPIRSLQGGLSLFAFGDIAGDLEHCPFTL